MKFLCALFLLVLIFSCTKKIQYTSSKIKIFGSRAFSVGGALETKASNGLVLWGISTEGKSFTQKIENDTLDIELPNGTWNFYAVAWELSGANSYFQGKTYCGKSTNNKLSGTEVSINLNLLNANCADADLSSNASTVSSEVVFPFEKLVSCRNISGLISYSDMCTRQIGSATSTRGFATFYKIAIPQYKNFDGNTVPTGSRLESGCIEVDSTFNSGDVVIGSIQTSGTILASTLRIPDAKNGLGVLVKTFFSRAACDEGTGAIDIPLVKTATSFSKMFSTTPVAGTQTTEKIFLKTTEEMVCSQNRTTTDKTFAGGRGTFAIPFYICTKDQFNLIDAKFSDGDFNTANKNFELLKDLDFGFGPINIIGGSTASASQSYTGTVGDPLLFEGNNHRLENILLTCGNVNQPNVGIIRNAFYVFLQNLIVNKISIQCPSSDRIGGLFGSLSNGGIYNAKVMGFVEGNQYVGGVVGSLSNSNLELVHANTNVNASNDYAGVLAGELQYTTSGSIISKVSTKGSVRSETANVGGLAGFLFSVVSNAVTADNLAINSDVNGDSYVGGFWGASNNSGDAILRDSYVKGTLTVRGPGGMIGGLTGYVGFPITIDRVYFLTNKILMAGMFSSAGGVYGATSNDTYATCTNVFYLDDSAWGVNTAGTCNDPTIHNKNLADLTTATQAFVSVSPTNWSNTIGGFPRLKAEETAMADVPYLNQKVCDGHYAPGNIAGSGTVESPYLICSYDQFLAMVPGPYYVFKEDIFGSYIQTLPSFASGEYHIDGENHTISGLHIVNNSTGGNGLFQKLRSGSYLKNLKIFKSFIQIPDPFQTNFYLGLVAGINEGIISNVKIYGGTINEASSSLNSSVSTGTDTYIGGVVGLNSGVIQDVRSDIVLNVASSSMNSNANPIYVGGVVGGNQGTIKNIRQNGSLMVDPAMINSTDRYGGIVALNNGLIESVDMDNSLTWDAATNVGGAFRMGVVAAVNNSNIQDVSVGPYLSMNSITSFTNQLLVPESISSATFDRVIFEPKTIVGFIPSSVSSLFPGSGSTTESFCLSSQVSGCTSNTTGLFSFTAPYFSFSGYVSSSTSWNMVETLLPDFNYKWIYYGTDGPPELMRTGGSWNDLGKGF